ncbi:MAG TPA: sulfate adenylyltransferase subunit CysD [Polyangiales bacterium]|nr:sulfate adenylyltransferase subunit CysD [Polyangiales bacterium]
MDLAELEAESIFVIRETAAQFDKPALMFSGGKDSIVMAHLARKAFHPARFPFPLLHVDTGHNFRETIEFRDRYASSVGAELIVASVQRSIDEGLVEEETGPYASRNALQIPTLLRAIEEHGFDACLGGGRRDEEKARAKERFFSHRDRFGQWDPKNQRPELWNLYSGIKRKGENFRVFPLSNWTELDVWRYIREERIELPSLYFAARRECLRRHGSILAISEFVQPRQGETVETKSIRFRTMGDAPITGAVESTASDLDGVIRELLSASQTERGNRADDQLSENAMEDRKKQGYF